MEERERLEERVLQEEQSELEREREELALGEMDGDWDPDEDFIQVGGGISEQELRFLEEINAA